MKEYRLLGKYRILYCVLGLFFLVLAFFSFSREETFFKVLFYGLLLFSISGFINALNERIILSSYGIEYYTGLLKTSSKWETGFTIVSKWDWIDRQDFMVCPKSNMFPLIPSKNYFPLSRFSENWRDSELGQQIKQYVPHLFQ